MSEPNFAQQSGNFATDAVVDTEADKLANTVIDNVVSYAPHTREKIEELIKALAVWTKRLQYVKTDEKNV